MKVKYYLKNETNFYVYFKVRIMVRVRGFGQTLDRVIVRTLGREVSCDVDEGPNGKDQQPLHLGNKKFHLWLWMLSM